MSFTYGDSFTDTDGVLLQDHVPDSGTPFSWVRQATFSNDDAQIRDGRAMVDNPAGTVAQYHAAVNPGNTLEFDVVVTGQLGDAGINVYLLTDPAVFTGYGVAVRTFDGVDVELDVVRKSNGTTVNFTFGSSFALTTGTHRIKLEVLSGSVKAYWDGVLKTTLADATFSAFAGVGLSIESGTTDGAFRAMEITSIGTPFVEPVDEVLLDRRFGATGVFSGGNTTWTLPYSVATNGSEGVVQVVQSDGTVIPTTRPTATTVRAVGDFSADAMTIGLRYEFKGQLSTIYLRNADYTGIPRADARKRLQLQRIRFLHDRTYKYDVLVKGTERSVTTYPFAASVADNKSLRVPVLSNNELVTITLQSLYPLPCWITGAEWEGIFKATSGLR